ncbi:recombinase family protein [Rhodococcus pyridinivorans]|uniref:recombinase family protein n=1 Tax=Rhodococcus pyridinivorans TaxID=103816 RepID=UPI001EE715B7|nr:recombinase family protein [Rhodococcus pyridinivorans]
MSGSTGQESSLTHQEAMLRESATGAVYRVYKDRGSGLREKRAGLDRLLDDAARGHFTVVRVVWRDRLARFGVVWIERYLSVVGVTVEVLREQIWRSAPSSMLRCASAGTRPVRLRAGRGIAVSVVVFRPRLPLRG